MLRVDKNTKNHNKTPTHTITDTYTDVALVKLMTDALEGSTEDYRVRIPDWDATRCCHWETSIKKINHWDTLNFNYIPETDTFNFNKRSFHVMTQLINPEQYTSTVGRLRSFFLDQGFHEVHTQNRLSILAACEDPTTVSTYNYAGNVWPLPQTGQMWLEYELLTRPSSKGFFCVSTSYRQEPNPVPGRHDLIFPMFEFEFPGTVADLEIMNKELTEHMGFGSNPVAKDYLEWAKDFDTKELTHKDEEAMYDKYKDRVCMIKNFPNYTSPFWNMKQNGDGTAAKIDVIIAGQETIGSAERSSDPEEMKHMFHTISDGQYADLLYGQFGKERVEAELNEFLSYDFQPRVGGGIGMTRMIRAVEEYKKIAPPSIRKGRPYRVGSKNFKSSFLNAHGIPQ